MTHWIIRREVADHPPEFWGAVLGWGSKSLAVRFVGREDADRVIDHLFVDRRIGYAEYVATEVRE